ncbi:hypothetical protein RKE29_00785 [Streptomyces sp. B1866]|uniref:hypothetical protein n=1 Tax=Streptomyces sp. B1866 TaxID=3075431 RepID=UPI00288F24FE|nr:hypothetical protein [Streptomyces sp. B1866]MDT3395200.1 hypothetical protein [Streptomyces sp. B1866]
MKALARPGLEVVMVHGLLGWLYSAAVAAVHPDSLPGPLTSLLPVRRDTFGACCFAASAAAAFVLQAGPGPLWARLQRRPGPVDAALRTAVGYALLVWGYLVVNSLTHPRTTALPLTHFASFPSEGTAAAWSFAGSAAALLALRARAGRTAHAQPPARTEPAARAGASARTEPSARAGATVRPRGGGTP